MKDHTELVILLDRSGSMQSCKDDHEGGLRSFVHDQRKLAGHVLLTFVRFDSHNPFELVYDGVPIDQVEEKELTLIPRGDTPLLAAVGMTIEHVADRLKKETRQPDQVVVMIITDGQENASGRMERTFTREQIKQMVAEREKTGWKVLYLGANVDEFAEGSGLGLAASASLGYAPSSSGVSGAYSGLSMLVCDARQAVQEAGPGAMQLMGDEQKKNFYDTYYIWTDIQRKRAKDQPSKPQSKKE